MRRIIDGTAYDTDTGELIMEVGFNDAHPDEGQRLYRTRNGAFFLWEQYVTPSYRAGQDIVPLSDAKTQEWLEKYGNELVEKYFGEMPEGGAAERRITLRMPSNLGERLNRLAESNNVSVNRYIVRCLERCVAQDGQPVIPV